MAEKTAHGQGEPRERPHQKAGDPFLIVHTQNQPPRVLRLGDLEAIAIGRDASCDIVLDGDSEISRLHCRLIRQGQHWFVKDNHSTNSTRVNGETITLKRLEPGDAISVGGAILEFDVPTTLARGHGRALRTHFFFEERFQEEIDRSHRFGRPFALLMIKPRASETTGKAIDALGLALVGLLRTIDILALYAADEFEVLLPETSKNDAFLLAERMRDLAATLPEPQELAIGLCGFPEDAHSKDLLVEKARKALRLALQQKAPVTDAEHSGQVRHLATSTSHATAVIFKDPAMLALLDVAARAAKAEIAVLITGETGVGKEVLAQTIHRQSLRADKPLICINCAALPDALLESELFGHERGAFTGAEKQKQGLFEAAHGGTLFMDEVGDIPPATQVKVLRALQEKKVRRLGSTKEIVVDVRIIAATNKSLEVEVAAGRFRSDLYFRLQGLSLFIPALRDRPCEILPFAEAFLDHFRRQYPKHISFISEEAREALTSYPWPGNIRELRNCIERAVVLADGDTIKKEHLSLRRGVLPAERHTAPTAKSILSFQGDPMSASNNDINEAVEKYEAHLIKQALDTCDGNQTKAALQLNLPRRTLVSKIKKYGL